jgi:hypothetical protein
MADATYNRGLKEIDGQSWESADIRVLLVDSGYTLDKDHNFVSDLTPGTNELAGTGYTRKTVANATATEDDTGDRLVLDHDDIVYTAIDAGTADAAIYFRFVTNDADSPLWFYKDSGFPFVTNGSDMTIATGANGLATLADA